MWTPIEREGERRLEGERGGGGDGGGNGGKGDKGIKNLSYFAKIYVYM